MGKYSIESDTLTAIADAIREKGGTADAILTEGMAAAIAAIEAGGSNVVLPDGCVLVSGSFVPATEGTGTTWEITLAKALKNPGYNSSSVYGKYPVPFFMIYRKDGFTASGGNSERYLVTYVSLAGDGKYGCGAGTYRHLNATDLTCIAGGDTSSVKYYGFPPAGVEYDNCFIRLISSYDPILKFGTMGINTLEAGCEYAWMAVLDGSEYEV